ncbi:IS200/IS605 family transposase [Aeropyrum pernix]|uniref:IS200/IS605 family transposase n=1 Tax=Aeropyrum pernix TaxID=56636 RepID=A0A401H912_AERPX|nr:IS200/IS605 family transposase [Aeropyrum pernix]GBF08858.1 IS200/IS605 family transposase [Aeropyrum pernix]
MGEPLTWNRLRRTRHTRYWCGYHFVWIPKYRRDILVGEIAEYTREVLKHILEELDCEPIALEVMPDHVHVFTLCPPRLSPAYIANYLKGKSARRILQRFPELRTKASRGKLWSRSYFVATVGNVTAEVVKRYVEEQWEKEK